MSLTVMRLLTVASQLLTVARQQSSAPQSMAAVGFWGFSREWLTVLTVPHRPFPMGRAGGR